MFTILVYGLVGSVVMTVIGSVVLMLLGCMIGSMNTRE